MQTPVLLNFFLYGPYSGALVIILMKRVMRVKARVYMLGS